MRSAPVQAFVGDEGMADEAAGDTQETSGGKHSRQRAVLHQRHAADCKLAYVAKSRKNSAESSTNALDLALLDAFAQAEALMRCGRDIQRGIIRLRGGDGVMSATERAVAIEKVRATAAKMHGECAALVPLARDVVRAAKMLE